MFASENNSRAASHERHPTINAEIGTMMYPSPPVLPSFKYETIKYRQNATKPDVLKHLAANPNRDILQTRLIGGCCVAGGVWYGFKMLERDNGRDHRVATNKLNIKTRDNRDFGASHGYHDSLRDGLPDHRARLNQRLVPGALRPRR